MSCTWPLDSRSPASPDYYDADSLHSTGMPHPSSRPPPPGAAGPAKYAATKSATKPPPPAAPKSGTLQRLGSCISSCAPDLLGSTPGYVSAVSAEEAYHGLAVCTYQFNTDAPQENDDSADLDLSPMDVDMRAPQFIFEADATSDIRIRKQYLLDLRQALCKESAWLGPGKSFPTSYKDKLHSVVVKISLPHRAPPPDDLDDRFMVKLPGSKLPDKLLILQRVDEENLEMSLTAPKRADYYAKLLHCKRINAACREARRLAGENASFSAARASVYHNVVFTSSCQTELRNLDPDLNTLIERAWILYGLRAVESIMTDLVDGIVISRILTSQKTKTKSNAQPERVSELQLLLDAVSLNATGAKQMFILKLTFGDPALTTVINRHAMDDFDPSGCRNELPTLQISRNTRQYRRDEAEIEDLKARLRISMTPPKPKSAERFDNIDEAQSQRNSADMDEPLGSEVDSPGGNGSVSEPELSPVPPPGPKAKGKAVSPTKAGKGAKTAKPVVTSKAAPAPKGKGKPGKPERKDSFDSPYASGAEDGYDASPVQESPAPKPAKPAAGLADAKAKADAGKTSKAANSKGAKGKAPAKADKRMDDDFEDDLPPPEPKGGAKKGRRKGDEDDDFADDMPPPGPKGGAKKGHTKSDPYDDDVDDREDFKPKKGRNDGSPPREAKGRGREAGGMYGDRDDKASRTKRRGSMDMDRKGPPGRDGREDPRRRDPREGAPSQFDMDGERARPPPPRRQDSEARGGRGPREQGDIRGDRDTSQGSDMRGPRDEMRGPRDDMRGPRGDSRSRDEFMDRRPEGRRGDARPPPPMRDDGRPSRGDGPSRGGAPRGRGPGSPPRGPAPRGRYA